MANDTCEFVPLPEGAFLIKSKLVPSLKYRDDNTIKEFCIRWVGCGYSQVEGVNYNETFTATSKATSIRVFIAMVMHLRLIAKEFYRTVRYITRHLPYSRIQVWYK